MMLTSFDCDKERIWIFKYNCVPFLNCHLVLHPIFIRLLCAIYKVANLNYANIKFHREKSD